MCVYSVYMYSCVYVLRSEFESCPRFDRFDRNIPTFVRNDHVTCDCDHILLCQQQQQQFLRGNRAQTQTGTLKTRLGLSALLWFVCLLLSIRPEQSPKKQKQNKKKPRHPNLPPIRHLSGGHSAISGIFFFFFLFF